MLRWRSGGCPAGHMFRRELPRLPLGCVRVAFHPASDVRIPANVAQIKFKLEVNRRRGGGGAGGEKKTACQPPIPPPARRPEENTARLQLGEGARSAAPTRSQPPAGPARPGPARRPCSGGPRRSPPEEGLWDPRGPGEASPSTGAGGGMGPAAPEMPPRGSGCLSGGGEGPGVAHRLRASSRSCSSGARESLAASESGLRVGTPPRTG
ncbi:uncharacterized protein PHA67_023551 isoform 1-T3 [Liasis olivaceus]